jgi:uncharacterized protein YfdQ (DUF2303 family)
MNEELESAKQIFELGTEQTRFDTIETGRKSIPVYVVPSDMKVVDMASMVEQNGTGPTRLKECFEVLSVESFIRYYNRYATEYSSVFLDTDNSSLRAVFDYHEEIDENGEGGFGAWKDHTAEYKCPKSISWSNWAQKDNQKMSQEDFALFIEDNIRDIQTPNGAELMQIVSTLRSTTDVEFESGVRLSDGQVNFKYKETVNGTAGANGEFAIPTEFTIAVKPFQNSAPYGVKAKFRYRKGRDGMAMWYSLQQPHLIIEDAIADIEKSVREGMEKGHFYHGK